jgi:hypothetical protein
MPPMIQQYEYTHLPARISDGLNPTNAEFAATLNELGRAGWMLAAATPIDLIFMRPAEIAAANLQPPFMGSSPREEDETRARIIEDGDDEDDEEFPIYGLNPEDGHSGTPVIKPERLAEIDLSRAITSYEG